MKGRVIVVSHPLVRHKLALLRDRRTNSRDFRDLLEELSTLLAYEVTRDLPTSSVRVHTPLGVAEGRTIPGKMLGVVAILRAGLGMAEGILRLVPGAKLGHIGLYRDPKTLRPVEYFRKLPSDLARRQIIVTDPMLATGYSAAYAVNLLKERGARKISLMCLLAARRGLRVFHKIHPEVTVYCAGVDPVLDSHGYIRPGLGDAGDRLFGTR